MTNPFSSHPHISRLNAWARDGSGTVIAGVSLVILIVGGLAYAAECVDCYSRGGVYIRFTCVQPLP